LWYEGAEAGSISGAFEDLDVEDCGALEDTFTYTVMGRIPTEGPETR